MKCALHFVSAISVLAFILLLAGVLSLQVLAQEQQAQQPPHVTITEIPIPTPNSLPICMITGPAGDGWFVETLGAC